MPALLEKIKKMRKYLKNGNYLNIGKITSLMIIIISAIRKISIESLFMPCIYFIHCVRGSFGSLFFMYKYSAIWLQIPILIVLLY